MQLEDQMVAVHHTYRLDPFRTNPEVDPRIGHYEVPTVVQSSPSPSDSDPRFLGIRMKCLNTLVSYRTPRVPAAP